MGKPLREAWNVSEFKIPIVLSIIAGVLMFVIYFAFVQGFIDLAHFHIEFLPEWVRGLAHGGLGVLFILFVPGYLLYQPERGLQTGAILIILSFLALLSPPSGRHVHQHGTRYHRRHHGHLEG